MDALIGIPARWIDSRLAALNAAGRTPVEAWDEALIEWREPTYLERKMNAKQSLAHAAYYLMLNEPDFADLSAVSILDKARREV